jgi:hypothetical protein
LGFRPYATTEQNHKSVSNMKRGAGISHGASNAVLPEATTSSCCQLVELGLWVNLSFICEYPHTSLDRSACCTCKRKDQSSAAVSRTDVNPATTRTAIYCTDFQSVFLTLCITSDHCCRYDVPEESATACQDKYVSSELDTPLGDSQALSWSIAQVVHTRRRRLPVRSRIFLFIRLT